MQVSYGKDPASHPDPESCAGDRNLQDVLRRLPSLPPDQLEELLPDVWFASYPTARRKAAA
jgi:hypothetical protein